MIVKAEVEIDDNDWDSTEDSEYQMWDLLLGGDFSIVSVEVPE